MDAIRVARVDPVVLERFVSGSRHRQTGVLHLTPHHLIFSPSSSSTATTDEVWIPYPTITLLTRLPQAISGLYPLQVRTRTFDDYVLFFEKDREGGAEDVWQSVKDCAVASELKRLGRSSWEASVEQLYAFFYTLSTTRTGWSTFNPRTEFARQGLGVRTKAWRFTDINKDYSFCPTYPGKLVVPSRISDSVLAYAGKYRSKGRIPALTYLHWANHVS